MLLVAVGSIFIYSPGMVILGSNTNEKREEVETSGEDGSEDTCLMSVPQQESSSEEDFIRFATQEELGKELSIPIPATSKWNVWAWTLTSAPEKEYRNQDRPHESQSHFAGLWHLILSCYSCESSENRPEFVCIALWLSGGFFFVVFLNVGGSVKTVTV